MLERRLVDEKTDNRDYESLIVEYLKVIPSARYHALLDTGLLGNRAIDYDDLYQEAALSICEKIHKYDETKGSFESYAYELAYWGIRALLKKNMNYYCDTCDLIDEITSSDIADSNISIEEAIDSLSINDRQLIEAIYINHKRIEEIASEMNTTKERITIKRDRVINKIKQKVYGSFF